VKCRGRTFTRNVTERQSQAAFTIGKEIVEITAQLAGRNVGSREIQARNFTRAARQELQLDFPRGIQIGLKTNLVFAGVLIKTGIFQSDGDERAKRDEHFFMLRGEGRETLAFQIKHADQTVLKQERHNQLRGNDLAGIAGDVARILADIVETDGLAGG